MKRIVLLILAMVIAFTPATAFAENGELEKGFVLRIDGDLHLGAGESLESAVVINGRAVIDGEVEETLVVISGSAVISGRVGDDVVLIDSDLELTESGLVGDDVILIDGDISRAVGSVVGGEVRDEFDFSIRWWELAIFSFVAWIGFTILAIFAGLVFAAVASRQMLGAAQLLSDDPAFSILASVLTFVALPIPAFFILFTGIGIPLGLSTLLLLLPALGFLGYLVAGIRIGSFILKVTGIRPDGGSPYFGVVVGLMLLQLILFVPLLGWLAAFLVAFWGAGGLVLYAWRAWRAPRVSSRQVN